MPPCVMFTQESESIIPRIVLIGLAAPLSRLQADNARDVTKAPIPEGPLCGPKLLTLVRFRSARKALQGPLSRRFGLIRLRRGAG